MNTEHIFEVITRHAREVLPSLAEHRFQPQESLRSLGANSIDRADILMMTLESLALNIPLGEMAKAENIGDLARIIHAKS